jgi:hypothetical protein
MIGRRARPDGGGGRSRREPVPGGEHRGRRRKAGAPPATAEITSVIDVSSSGISSARHPMATGAHVPSNASASNAYGPSASVVTSIAAGSSRRNVCSNTTSPAQPSRRIRATTARTDAVATVSSKVTSNE